jgi:KDO2-lipid IV(A) lauroyltransferase
LNVFDPFRSQPRGTQLMRWLFGTIAYAATRSASKVASLAIRILPRRSIFALSDRLATLGYHLFRGFRKRSVANLALALGSQADYALARRIARQSLRNFFRACVETLIALESSGEQVCRDIEVQGQQHLDAALRKGNGVIVLSAHLGNFFLVGTRLALAGYEPIYVLINQPRDGQLAKLMDGYRAQVRQRRIHARPRPNALRELTEVLRRNEVAIMIADEYRRGSGVYVPLFGRKVLARRGPATLASRTGAAVVPACMLRQLDDSLRLVIEPELELVRPGKTKSAIRENTLRMTRWLERTVRNHPDQWNWMNIRWAEALAEGKEIRDQSSEVRSQSRQAELGSRPPD